MLPVPFELILEGDNSITTTSGYGIALPKDEGKEGMKALSIRGSGSLTINAGREGIWTDGSLTVDGVNLTVTYGFASGLLTEYGDIVIQNGSQTDSGNGLVSEYRNVGCHSSANAQNEHFSHNFSFAAKRSKP